MLSTAIVIGVINISAQPPSLPEIGADIIQNQAFQYYNYDIKSELEKISNFMSKLDKMISWQFLEVCTCFSNYLTVISQICS